MFSGPFRREPRRARESSLVLAWARGETKGASLPVEEELLGVDQGPQDVFIGGLFFLWLRMLGEVFQHQLFLVRRGLAGESPQEQLIDLFIVRPGIPGEGLGPAAGLRELPLDLVRSQQV